MSVHGGVMEFVRHVLLMIGRFVKFSLDLVMGVAVTLAFWGKTGATVPLCKDPLLLTPAHVLAGKIRKREITSEAVVQAYIQRVREVNPLLNAVVDERFDAALAEAREVDRQIQTGHKSTEDVERETPFLGVPITIKENFQVTGMRQTVGMVARRNHRANLDADAVALVRRAGAIILGVTNVPELCSSWETNNKVYGRTNNPYNTKLIPGGSSGGEGSIISAAGSVMGIGSDIAGSIRLPAMFCGIFGHKPTWGVVSNSGSEPVLNEVLDQYLVTGPLCRYASDLRLLYKVLAGPISDNVLRLDEPVDLRKIRVFYLDENLGEPIVNSVQEDIKRAVKKAVYHLEYTFGCHSQRLKMEQLQHVVGMFLSTFVEESKCAMKHKLDKETGQVLSLPLEFLKWLVGYSDHTITPLALSTLEVTLKWYSNATYPHVNQMRQELAQNLETLLGNDGVLICPTHPTTAVLHTLPVTQFLNFMYTVTINLIGMPSTHCPLGLSSKGLPVGVQVVAALHQDRLTLAVAEALENGFGGWICPGVVSNSGSEPVLNEVLDQYLVTGPLCRYASDLRLLYKVLAGPISDNVLRLDEPVDLRKIRVFYLDENLGEPIVNSVQEDIKRAVKKAVYHLEYTFGCHSQRLKMEQLQHVVEMFLSTFVEESKCAMKHKLDKETGRVLSLPLEFLKWLVGYSDHTITPLALSTLEVTLKWYSNATYPHVNQMRQELAQNLETLLGNDGVLICPTHPTTAVLHTLPVTQFLNFMYTVTINLIGMPSTHCPLGLSSKGLPVGVQVVAAQHQDRLTLAVAEALESGFGGWICPGTPHLNNST